MIINLRYVVTNYTCIKYETGVTFSVVGTILSSISILNYLL